MHRYIQQGENRREQERNRKNQVFSQGVYD